MEKIKQFKDLRPGDDFYCIIPNRDYIKYRVKSISRGCSINTTRLDASTITSKDKVYSFNISDWKFGSDMIEFGKTILLMNHRVCFNPGKLVCDTFDSEDLGTSTKLYTYKISIPEKKIDDISIETNINTKITGVADITISKITKEILVQTDYGNGKLMNYSLSLDQCKDYKAIALSPLEEGSKSGLIISLDEKYAVEMIKTYLSKRLDNLLLSIEQTEKAAVKLQTQIDSL